MPIYEYRCQKGHLFEVRQSFSDAPVTQCEVCGAPVQRVFRPIAVHFKGSGFYNTDYGTRQRSREMNEAKESAKTEGGKDGAKEGGKEAAKETKSAGSESGSSSSKSDSGTGGAKKPETKAS
ncbi:MAG: zinc ribbon domain-containing protein [Actinomycetota bacterium]|nr:zinc ribbon domain-containing protein [Actinomycetota bacterium]